MKSHKASLHLALMLTLVSGMFARGQVYAPDTEYHDPVQRVFVVEMSRVLAWLSYSRATNGAEVVYQVTTKPDQSTAWDIRWVDSAGKTLKTVALSYPTNRLNVGPDFYRSVFKELWMVGWGANPPLQPRETAERFWQGAAGMGLSRETGLQAAFELMRHADEKSMDRWMPELAGLLIHTTLHGTADRLSLDSVILARGAAWLALSEYLTSSRLDGLWAPVLFQAGRENAAAALWNKEYSAVLDKPTPQQAGWNIWLRKPKSKEVFLFATESTNLPMAMPMLAYEIMVNETGRLLGELTPNLVRSATGLASLHNYAPAYAVATGIGGGRLLEGAWAVHSRRAWLRLLSMYPVSVHDFSGYLTPLRAATNSLSAKRPYDENLDASLIGLKEVIPLLRLGRKEGVGPCTPVAVATARDLLNYGWEMTGLQMGSRYRFIRNAWGVTELAEPILKTVTGELEGLMPFFLSASDANITTYGESLHRLQLVDGFYGRVGYHPPFMPAAVSISNGASIFVKRCWLRPHDFEWQSRMLWDANKIPDITRLIVTFGEHGGALAAAEVLRYLVKLDEQPLNQILQGQPLDYSLADRLPEPTQLYVQAVFNRDIRSTNNFHAAQVLEKLYWSNPDSGLENRVFRNYAVAPAYKSARRFYLQCRENIVDEVQFSNQMGKMVYLMGYLFHDPELCKFALEDSASASHADMVLHIWDAAIRNNIAELKTTVQEMVERYEGQLGADSQGRSLLKFLPLLPALKDPKHRARQEALHYFGKEENWIVLKWLWIEQFKLPVEDAITFLGGRETTPFQTLLICYLEKDASRMLDALNSFGRSRSWIDQYNVLATFLYYKLHPIEFNYDQADLKPPGAESTRAAVLAKLKAKR